ncbi:MAG: hypothetical protein K2X69_17650, partial [Silvanigrellaceae bacterium]|nr:hypothetical protein [Silvanigrellaceae bacterium]
AIFSTSAQDVALLREASHFSERRTSPTFLNKQSYQEKIFCKKKKQFLKKRIFFGIEATSKCEASVSSHAAIEQFQTVVKIKKVCSKGVFFEKYPLKMRKFF